jgi:transcription elongation factor Elf1
MPLELKGATFAKREGDSIQYRYTCDKCGHIEGTIRSTTAGDKSSNSFTSFKCYNCGNLQQVEIRE